jgi:formylglycine-generating enzyme required for sulfatase activity
MSRLEDILEMKAGPRMAPLTELGRELAASEALGRILRDRVVAALLDLLEGYAGNGRQRMDMGEVLGLLGDRRLREPTSPDYWVMVPMPDGQALEVARYPVTTAEFRAWLESGGYDKTAAWSELGRAWLETGADRWDVLASNPESAHLVVANQPVAGPTWWEADAYARSVGARLLTADEHRSVVRGLEKRPYPWGAPFGDGNANTKEEALGRPCAVGVFAADCTPEGASDLAGNMGCWLSDAAEDGRRMLHPGSWARPSMASWAKALEMADPGTRSADLSFRLVRDPS